MDGRDRIQRFKSALDRNLKERKEVKEIAQQRPTVEPEDKENVDPMQHIVSQAKRVEIRKNAFKNNSNSSQESIKVLLHNLLV